MHRWVSRRDTIGTIESALELAEAYEDEYGPTSVLQSLPVSVNARDSTGNALAVAIPSAASTKTVSVDAAVPDQGDLSLTTQMQAGFKNIEKQITQQFATIDTRLGAVEKYQGEQIRRWENRRSKNQQRRDGKRAKTWNESRGDRQSSWHSKSEENAGKANSPARRVKKSLTRKSMSGPALPSLARNDCIKFRYPRSQTTRFVLRLTALRVSSTVGYTRR